MKNPENEKQERLISYESHRKRYRQMVNELYNNKFLTTQEKESTLLKIEANHNSSVCKLNNFYSQILNT